MFKFFEIALSIYNIENLFIYIVDFEQWWYIHGNFNVPATYLHIERKSYL